MHSDEWSNMRARESPTEHVGEQDRYIRTCARQDNGARQDTKKGSFKKKLEGRSMVVYKRLVDLCGAHQPLARAFRWQLLLCLK